jgi:tetratricopeptide (TPR) repeat protein
MNKFSFVQWYQSTGSLRVSLLVIAILGKVLLYILNPPNYISGAVLIRPFPLLLGLDIVNLVFGSIILVECIRIIADRSTSAWSLKRHFSLVLTFIIGHAIFYVIIISPAKSNYYYKYGWSLSEEKDYKQAIFSFDIAVKYNPENLEAYLERGYAHRKLGDLASALNDYNKVIEIDSKNPDGYEGKGYVYYYLDDCENALKQWNTAIALDPQRSNRLDGWING